MKYFIPFTFLLLLFSCQKTIVEVYTVEKYPMDYTDTIISKPTHWHYRDINNNWNCMEIEQDTFVLQIKDTMYVRTLECVYRKKEYNQKWRINKIENERCKIY
jgi:hypothetical protein